MAKDTSNQNTTDLKELEKINTTLYFSMTNLPKTLEENEEVFINANRFKEGSTLLGSLAVWNIAENKLWEGKFRSIAEYFKECETRLKVKSKSYVYDSIKIAEAYIRYRDPLIKAGFKEDSDSSKLRVFHQAVAIYGVDESIKKLPKVSFKEYKKWIRAGGGDTLLLDDASGEDGGDEELIEITHAGIRYNKKLIISTNKIQKIIESGENPVIFGIKGEEEEKAVNKFLKEYRKD